MTLPASFLQHIEQHPCFTGCYGSDSAVRVCLDGNAPLESMIMVSCQDCLARFGVPASLLPNGMTTYSLAQVLTDHVRAERGFTLSVSGYHARGPGFWLSAAYYGCGVFLINGERSRQKGSDLDLLLLSFQAGILHPPDPRMLDPKQYSLQTVHVNYSTAKNPIGNKQDLLTSPQCRLQPRPGWQRVTLAEFKPLAIRRVPQPLARRLSAPRTRPLQPGDLCPQCGAEVRERQLLNSTYIGCLC